ncbi:MAG: aminopeptidase [Caproiciproducens sp.]|nr:aminopeptidase [Caproiciproducens sp.]
MKNAKPISLEMRNKFEQSYQSSKLLKAMTNALAKNSVDTIAFVPSSAKNTQFKFSIDIPTMEVTNQKKSGRCWIFSGLNVLREIIGKKYNIEKFEFSQNYIAFWDKFEKINYFLESVIDLSDQPVDDRTLTYVLMTGIQDGGQWDMLVSLIKKYGLVPKDAMDETYQSSNTSAMNGLIDTKLKQYASVLQRQFAAGKSREELDAEKQKMLNEMYSLLCACFGVPPTAFDFEYVDREKNYVNKRNLTPNQFYKEYLGDILDDYVSITNAPTKDKPFNRTYTVDYLGNVLGGSDIQYLNLELSTFKKLILSQLTDRQVVWFGSDVGKFGDREAGIWDDKAYDYEAAFDMNFDLTKEEGLDYRQSAMNHAMVITGVNLDEDGNPTKWKIENSWSDEKGCKGYYVMSDSWFDKYVYQAVVNKKYLDKALLELFKLEPIHLSPWDPMGSLAD